MEAAMAMAVSGGDADLIQRMGAANVALLVLMENEIQE